MLDARTWLRATLVLASLGACDPSSTTTPTSDARLSGPGDADAEYPPTCSELGPATCSGPCSRGDAASCLHLAEGHLEGVGVAHNPARAMELMRGACDDGLGRACAHLAAAIGRQKLTESTALWRKGCELGYGGACIQYVGLHVLEQTPPNWSAAAPWLRKGCEAEYAYACVLWGDLLRVGKGTAADPAAARAAYRLACDGGLDEGCAMADGNVDGKRVHAIVTPEPSVRDAADLRGQLSNLRGRYTPEVKMCTVWMGTLEITSIDGAPPGLEALIRRVLARWRFTPSSADAPRTCTSLTLDFRMESGR